VFLNGEAIHLFCVSNSFQQAEERIFYRLDIFLRVSLKDRSKGKRWHKVSSAGKQRKKKGKTKPGDLKNAQKQTQRPRKWQRGKKMPAACSYLMAF
jgi:hypothetical protein